MLASEVQAKVNNLHHIYSEYILRIESRYQKTEKYKIGNRRKEITSST